MKGWIIALATACFLAVFADNASAHWRGGAYRPYGSYYRGGYAYPGYNYSYTPGYYAPYRSSYYYSPGVYYSAPSYYAPRYSNWGGGYYYGW